MAVCTNRAATYPSARFLVVALAPDGSDIEDLGRGLALPTTPSRTCQRSGSAASSAPHTLLDMLRRTMDARLIWVDAELEPWPD